MVLFIQRLLGCRLALQRGWQMGKRAKVRPRHDVSQILAHLTQNGAAKKKLAEKQLGCVVVQDLTPSLNRRYYQKKKKADLGCQKHFVSSC